MTIKLINRDTEGELLLEGRLDATTSPEAEDLILQVVQRFDKLTLNMNQLQISNMIFQMGEVRPVADTGAVIYLLLMNPVATFAEILTNQVAGGAGDLSIRQFFGSNTDSFLATYWIPISLAVQTLLSALFIRGAIYFLNPVKNEKK